MKYYDEYQSLYHEEDDGYLEYVDRELNKIKRRYDRNESKRVTKRNK